MWSLILLSCLLLPLSAVAQSGGEWKMNVSEPATGPGSGCIVLAQIASLSSPDTLTALKPVCPKSAPHPPPPGGETLQWPLSTDGDGAASSLALYADLPVGDGTTHPGCVMVFRQEQVAYLLGRDLQFNSNLGQIWDFTAAGFLLDPINYATLTCRTSHPYLPEDLRVPGPIANDADADVWAQSITVPGMGDGEADPEPEPTRTLAPMTTASEATSSSPSSPTSTEEPTSSERITTEERTSASAQNSTRITQPAEPSATERPLQTGAEETTAESESIGRISSSVTQESTSGSSSVASLTSLVSSAIESNAAETTEPDEELPTPTSEQSALGEATRTSSTSSEDGSTSARQTAEVSNATTQPATTGAAASSALGSSSTTEEADATSDGRTAIAEPSASENTEDESFIKTPPTSLEDDEPARTSTAKSTSYTGASAITTDVSTAEDSIPTAPISSAFGDDEESVTTADPLTSEPASSAAGKSDETFVDDSSTRSATTATRPPTVTTSEPSASLAASTRLVDDVPETVAETSLSDPESGLGGEPSLSANVTEPMTSSVHTAASTDFTKYPPTSLEDDLPATTSSPGSQSDQIALSSTVLATNGPSDIITSSPESAGADDATSAITDHLSSETGSASTMPPDGPKATSVIEPDSTVEQTSASETTDADGDLIFTTPPVKTAAPSSIGTSEASTVSDSGATSVSTSSDTEAMPTTSYTTSSTTSSSISRSRTRSKMPPPSFGVPRFTLTTIGADGPSSTSNGGGSIFLTDSGSVAIAPFETGSAQSGADDSTTFDSAGTDSGGSAGDNDVEQSTAAIANGITLAATTDSQLGNDSDALEPTGPGMGAQVCCEDDTSAERRALATLTKTATVYCTPCGQATSSIGSGSTLMTDLSSSQLASATEAVGPNRVTTTSAAEETSECQSEPDGTCTEDGPSEDGASDAESSDDGPSEGGPLGDGPMEDGQSESGPDTEAPGGAVNLNAEGPALPGQDGPAHPEDTETVQVSRTDLAKLFEMLSALFSSSSGGSSRVDMLQRARGGGGGGGHRGGGGRGGHGGGGGGGRPGGGGWTGEGQTPGAEEGGQGEYTHAGSAEDTSATADTGTGGAIDSSDGDSADSSNSGDAESDSSVYSSQAATNAQVQGELAETRASYVPSSTRDYEFSNMRSSVTQAAATTSSIGFNNAAEDGSSESYDEADSTRENVGQNGSKTADVSDEISQVRPDASEAAPGEAQIRTSATMRSAYQSDQAEETASPDRTASATRGGFGDDSSTGSRYGEASDAEASDNARPTTSREVEATTDAVSDSQYESTAFSASDAIETASRGTFGVSSGGEADASESGDESTRLGATSNEQATDVEETGQASSTRFTSGGSLTSEAEETGVATTLETGRPSSTGLSAGGGLASEAEEISSSDGLETDRASSTRFDAGETQASEAEETSSASSTRSIYSSRSATSTSTFGSSAADERPTSDVTTASPTSFGESVKTSLTESTATDVSPGTTDAVTDDAESTVPSDQITEFTRVTSATSMSESTSTSFATTRSSSPDQSSAAVSEVTTRPEVTTTSGIFTHPTTSTQEQQDTTEADTTMPTSEVEPPTSAATSESSSSSIWAIPTSESTVSETTTSSTSSESTSSSTSFEDPTTSSFFVEPSSTNPESASTAFEPSTAEVGATGTPPEPSSSSFEVPSTSFEQSDYQPESPTSPSPTEPPASSAQPTSEQSAASTAEQSSAEGNSDVTVIGQFTPSGEIPGLPTTTAIGDGLLSGDDAEAATPTADPEAAYTISANNDDPFADILNTLPLARRVHRETKTAVRRTALPSSDGRRSRRRSHL